MGKYNWDLIEPYLDVDLSLSSRGRKNDYITLKQFKEYIQNGLTVVQIGKITSKNLVVFFSKLSKGAITLTKEIFEKEYNSGKSLVKIAEENNISKDYIGYLRQLYQIKVKGATFINRKNTEVALTPRQKEIIYGSMMGDAKKFAQASIGFGQCENQKEYLEWKYNELKSLVTKRGIKKEAYYDKRSGNTHVSYRFYTYSNTELEEINKQFYGSESKQIANKILKNLTPLSIAVWYMDDGRTDWNYRKRKYGKHVKEYYSFCTDSFSLESCRNIKDWFFESYNIKVRIKQRGCRKDGVPKYRIIVEHDSNEDFIRLISPHVLPMFGYKINYEKYLKRRKKNG